MVGSEIADRVARGANALDQLAPAFVAAYSEIGNVVKNAANPHFGSEYADLGAIMDHIKPVLARHGLSLIQIPGGVDGDRMSLHNIILHTSGQNISVATQLPLGGKLTPQTGGSAISYARRYAAAAIFGIAQVDDDGNAASTPKKVDPAALAKKIAAATNADELAALKADVEAAGDDALVSSYLARRKDLKAKR